MTLWHCFPAAARILTPARRATRHALPVHPPLGRPLRRFRRATAATPAASGATLVCVRLAALAVPLALGPAALPAPVALGPSLPFVGGFGPIISGSSYVAIDLERTLDRDRLRDGRHLPADGLDVLGAAGGSGGDTRPDTGLLPQASPADLTPAAVPEPTGAGVLLAALAAFTILRRRA